MTSSDPLTWKGMTFWTAAFLAAWLVGASIAVKLATGVWGGTPNDPLWVGPVSAAAGMVVAAASTVGYMAAKELATRHPGPPARPAITRVPCQSSHLEVRP
ncbi:MAG: hypothetical protein JWO11_4142 [Nocardioides sp.]|nr:hypothetical protein [Nocardioides sp.]